MRRGGEADDIDSAAQSLADFARATSKRNIGHCNLCEIDKRVHAIMAQAWEQHGTRATGIVRWIATRGGEAAPSWLREELAKLDYITKGMVNSHFATAQHHKATPKR